jgi:hypothetical protein
VPRFCETEHPRARSGRFSPKRATTAASTVSLQRLFSGFLALSDGADASEERVEPTYVGPGGPSSVVAISIGEDAMAAQLDGFGAHEDDLVALLCDHVEPSTSGGKQSAVERARARWKMG